jgi:hypothetical protein
VRHALVALAIVLAGTGPAAAELRKGPYLQELTPTSITVMWQADPVASGRVIVEGPGLPPTGRVIEVQAAAVARTVIDGLQPASEYRYRVELGDVREEGRFATAPELGVAAPLAFAVFGDNGSRPQMHRRIVEQVMTEAPDFVLGTGDLVNHADDAAMWQTLFDVERPLLRTTVVFPALGNHDGRAGGVEVATWRSLFSLPGRGTVGEGSPLYYGFSYGRSRFLILDSNARGAALDVETAWLERELAAARDEPRLDHIFVVMHHPLFSISRHGGKPVLRRMWRPLFERYRVTAVFSGHDHVYERAEVGGVHYFVSGGGGATPYGERSVPSRIDAAAVKRFASVNHYLKVTVDGQRVEVSAILASGTAIETTAWGPAASGDAPAATDVRSLRAPAAEARASGVVASAGTSTGTLLLAAAVGFVLVSAAMAVLRALRRDPLVRVRPAAPR